LTPIQVFDSSRAGTEQRITNIEVFLSKYLDLTEYYTILFIHLKKLTNLLFSDLDQQF